MVETRHLVASKAVVEKEVSEGMVEVGTETNQAVRLIGVRQLPGGHHCESYFGPIFLILASLPEENVSLLHCPGEHHGLLVVHIVVGRSVHHQVLLV